MPGLLSAQPSYRTLCGWSAAILVLSAATLWLGLSYGTLPVSGIVSEVAVAACFAAAGLAAWRLRPRSRTGVWLLLLGFVVIATNPMDLDLVSSMPGHGVVALVCGLTFWLQYVVAGHVVLAYPTGRLAGRPERRLIVAALGWAVVGSTVLLLTRTLDRSLCAPWCYDSPVQLVADRQLYVGLRTANAVVWIALTAIVVVFLVRRVARATPRERRVLGFPLVMFGLAVVCFLTLSVIHTAGVDGPVASAVFRYGHQWLAVLALPVTFFVGLLRERLAFASVGLLINRLERTSAGEVEAALSRTLQDPRLRVAFTVPGGLIDAAGQPFVPDATLARTPLGDPPVAVLVHDPAVGADPDLLAAAATAVRLALDNARLYAQVQGQLTDIQASRQRIVSVVDEERRRLERDLHDGAQQRFLGAGLSLAVLRGRLTGTMERDLIDNVEQELRAGIGELRDLAHGIRPAVLTDQGLGAALAHLARRSAVDVTLTVRVAERLDPVVEATAYYLVSEALQNVAKHVGAGRARVLAVREPDRLVIEVADNGRGGAPLLAGTGLRNMTDRVEAVGGRLTVTSTSGDGTLVRAELPCG